MSRHYDIVLVCDGSSDRALEHPIRWWFDHLGFNGTLSLSSLYPRAGSRELSVRIKAGMDRFAPDLIFVHRDSEGEDVQARINEIRDASEAAKCPWVPVIPIRMLEAWMLFDEDAIRAAAGNPNGRAPLNLPTINRVENIPDPKDRLVDALKTASELRGRRLKGFRPLSKRHLVAENIRNFEPLCVLETFDHVGMEISKFLK